ncbi:MAG TPA: hypothetical protein VH042_08195 [Solirubrobacterales bacterium]|jgi:hypothetical protein|nr:hypothetical protein [Solirubrobacterales bacterium]
MSRSRLGLKVLGLCALVVGVMAIAGASVAQAEVGAAWSYENASGTLKGNFSSTLEAEPVFALEGETGTLLIAEKPLSILCKLVEFDEGGQLAGEGSILLGRLKFSKCVGLIEGKVSAACEPVDPVSGKGTILTEKFTGLIKLHELANKEKDSTILLKADTGETLASLHMPGCGAGEEISIKGELVLWDCEGSTSAKTLKVTHLLAEFPGLKLMKVGTKSATLDGSANVSLKGAHLNYKWAALAI